MSGKSINFDDKRIEKSYFYKKNKNMFNIDDIDFNKILVSKKEPKNHMSKIMDLNTLLDTRIITLLDHYV